MAVASPVEYEVAVEQFLGSGSLSEASRRVYRISLTGWAWPLVDRAVPAGRQRRGATPPIVPLAMLDDGRAAARIAAGLAARASRADARTVSRELSALRSAVMWWQDQGWIDRDPTAGLRLPSIQARGATPLTAEQLAMVFGAQAGLREQSLWRLLYDTGAGAPAVLALDADAVSRSGEPTSAALAQIGPGGWSSEAGAMLLWLLSGRRAGPLFLTSRRAVAGTARADVCPLTRRARMSYRRAAEIFTEVTRPLDPQGHGWTLHQLRKPARLVLGR